MFFSRCKFLNFSKRTRCMKCSVEREDAASERRQQAETNDFGGGVDRRSVRDGNRDNERRPCGRDEDAGGHGDPADEGWECVSPRVKIEEVEQFESRDYSYRETASVHEERPRYRSSREQSRNFRRSRSASICRNYPASSRSRSPSRYQSHFGQ